MNDGENGEVKDRAKARATPRVGEERIYDIKEFVCGDGFGERLFGAVWWSTGGGVEDLCKEVLHSLSLAQGHIQKALRVGCIVRSRNHHQYRYR
jgi:hypothetical protein